MIPFQVIVLSKYFFVRKIEQVRRKGSFLGFSLNELIHAKYAILCNLKWEDIFVTSYLCKKSKIYESRMMKRLPSEKRIYFSS